MKTHKIGATIKVLKLQVQALLVTLFEKVDTNIVIFKSTNPALSDLSDQFYSLNFLQIAICLFSSQFVPYDAQCGLISLSLANPNLC